MTPATKSYRGCKGIPDHVWNKVCDLVDRLTPKEIQSVTGISMTKIYEIKRNPIKRGDLEA